MRATALIISSFLFIGAFVTVSNAQRFSPSSIISVPGFTGTKVYPGDYDNDGDDDILISGLDVFYSPVLRLYETDNGFLYEKQNSGLPQEVANAVWVDYDHDLDLDVFVYSSDWKISTASFYINSNGTFTQLPVSLPKMSYTNFSVIDYDQDNDVDLLMTGGDETSNSKSYLLKNSPNGFIAIPAPFVGDINGSFAWADFDKDNDLDVIVSSFYTSRLYTNNGQDSFTAFNSDFPGALSGQVQWADFDKDGDSDLLITGYNSVGLSSKIFVNNSSNKTFSVYTGVDLVGSDRGNSQWIDYDKDGDLDIFHSGYADGAFRMQLFEFNSSVYTEVTNLGFNVLYDKATTGIAFFDYDKDGDYDGLVLNDAYKARIFRNNLGTNPYPLDNRPANPLDLFAHPVNTTTIQLKWSDLDASEDYFSVEMSQSPSGPFTEVAVAPGYVPSPGSYIPMSVDVSGLTSGIEYYFRVRARSNSFGYSGYSNQVISSVASPDLVATSVDPIYNPYKSSWADIDNDGDLDIMYSGFKSPLDNFEPKTIILKNTNGNLSVQAHNLPQLTGFDIDWADYDLDGDLDLLLSGTPPSSGFARTKLLINEGNFTFTEYTQTPLLGVRSGFARWVDVNGDGYMDIYSSGTADGNNTVHVSQLMINNRDNTFVEKLNNGLPTLYQSALEINDFNNDGTPDFLMGGLKDTVNNNIALSTGLYLNDGKGTFKFHQEFMDSNDGSVKSADFDFDGDMDIIVSGNLNATRIYWNQNGKFQTDTSNQLPGCADGKLAVGDIDNDGDTDIIFGGRAKRVKLTRVFLNNGQGIFSEGYYALTPTATLFSVGDLDQDEDLDLFEISVNGPFNIFKNQSASVNAKPAAPTLSKVEPVAGGVKIMWQRGADDKTPTNSLTSNVFVKDVNGKYYFNSQADVTTGRLKKPTYGNAFLRDSIILQNLAPGDYTIGVQNIDNSFSASPFTTATVTIPYLAPTLVSNPMVCENSTGEIKVIGNSIFWYKDESLATRIGQGNTFKPMIKLSDSTFYAVQETGGIKSPVLQVSVKVVHKVTGPIIMEGDSLVAPIADFYQWYKDGINLDGKVKRKLLITGPGIYTLHASNNPCSEQTISYSVKPPPPTVQFTSELCAGKPQSLVASGTNIKWYNKAGSQIASGNNFSVPSVTLSDTVVFGTQTVNLVESDKAKVLWKVYAYPGKTITVENGVLMAPKGESYQWYMNDNKIEGAVNRELSTVNVGVYYVVADNHSCATTSDKVIFTGIENLEPNQSIFQRMPDGKVIVEAGNQIVREIIIYDFSGRKVLQFSAPEKINGFYELDASQLDIGVYLVYVDCDIPIKGKILKW